MSTYTANAHREGDWWVITVDGIGATQAKRLDHAENTARDLIAVMLDVDPATIEVTVAPQVGPELDGLVLSARNAADAAKQAQAAAINASRATAQRLKAAGYSLRDIGILTGVSYQRIHQLLGTAMPKPRPAVQVPRKPKVTTVKAGKRSGRSRVDA